MTLSQAFSAVSVADDLFMRRVYRWRPPVWVRWWMIGATRCGDGWLWAACGLMVLAQHSSTGHAAFDAAALAVAAGILIFRILKEAVGRKRPCGLAPHSWADLLPPDQFSFPSGHSVTAFAVALSLGQFFPAVFPFLLFSALSVAASRVFLGMHFLSDVVVGSVLGAILGYCAAAIFR